MKHCKQINTVIIMASAFVFSANVFAECPGSSSESIKKTLQASIVISGSISGNAVTATLTDNCNIVNNDNNFSVAAPILQAGNVPLTFANGGTWIFPGQPGNTTVPLDHVGSMAFFRGTNAGIVYAGPNSGSGVLITGPAQVSMAASALISGRPVSFQRYQVSLPIFDQNGVYVYNVAAGSLASVYGMD